LLEVSTHENLYFQCAPVGIAIGLYANFPSFFQIQIQIQTVEATLLEGTVTAAAAGPGIRRTGAGVADGRTDG
jgi:uncharacterized protein (DUF2062 family)